MFVCLFVCVCLFASSFASVLVCVFRRVLCIGGFLFVCVVVFVVFDWL